MSTTTLTKAGNPSSKVRGTVSIKAYVTDRPNFGLEEYEEVIFQRTAHMDIVMCITKGAIKTYRTGLNEFADSVQSIVSDEAKKAKIRDIRETVAWLENTANANFKVKPDTCMDKWGTGEDSFWDNVTMFQSVCVDKFDAKGIRIPTYWDGVSITLDNEGKTLNMTDPHDIAIYHVIMAGGFGMIAGSMQQAIDDGDYKFYLHKADDVAAIKTEHIKLRNKAGGCLETMLTGDINKLFYMAKLTAATGGAFYKIGGETATPLDQLYLDLSNYIEGKSGTGTREAVTTFLKYYDMPVDEMNVRCLIKDANELNLITIRNAHLTYIKTGATLGKTIEDAVLALQSPLHEDTYLSIRDTITAEWRK